MIWIWLVLIVAFFVIEVVTMDLFGIWFMFGALVAFIISSFSPDSVAIQIVVFLLVSIILLASTRPIAKKYITPRLVRTNADRIIGKVGIVLEDIKPYDKGAVKVDGKIWTAITNNEEVIESGSKVKVLTIEGVKAVVKKI